MKKEDVSRHKGFMPGISVAFGGLFPLEDTDPLQVV